MFYNTFRSIGVSVGEYTALGLMYYSLYLILIISCLALFATIIKETSITAVLGILLVIIGDSGINIQSWFNPLSYLYFDRIIIGGNSHPLIAIGIVSLIVTFVSILIFYLNKTTLIQNITFAFRTKDIESTLGKYETKRALPLPYLRFELLKMIKKKRTLISFTLILFFILVYGFSENIRYEEYRNSMVANHQIQANFYRDTLARDKALLAEEDLEQERIEAIERGLDELYYVYNSNTDAVKAYKNEDIVGIIEAQKFRLNQVSQSTHGGFPVEARDVGLAKLEEIKGRNVQPVISSTFGGRERNTSPFAYESSFRKNFSVSASQPSITYIFNNIFKNGLALLILAIFAIVLALGLSDETHDSNTMYLLNTQPLHRKRIYFGKLLAQSVVFIGIISILIGMLFLGLKLNGNPVERNFPAVQYQNEVDEDYTGVMLSRRNLTENRGKSLPASATTKMMGFTFRDMSEENREMTIMFLLSGLVIISFAMYASLTIRNKIGVSLATLLIFALGYITTRYILQGYGLILPFIWFNPSLIASGEGSMIFNVTRMNSLMGILILILWCGLFVYLGYRKFIKEYGRG